MWRHPSYGRYADNGLQQSIGKIFVLYGIVSGTKYFKPPNTKQKLVIFTYDVRMSHDHHFNYKFKIRNPVLFSWGKGQQITRI